MNRRLRLLAIWGVGVVLLMLSAPALAQTGGGFDLTWNSIDGGGGTSSGGTLAFS